MKVCTEMWLKRGQDSGQRMWSLAANTLSPTDTGERLEI